MRPPVRPRAGPLAGSGTGSGRLWFTIMEQLIAVPLFTLLSLVVLYWVIRLAVRDAIRDADRRRPQGRV